MLVRCSIKHLQDVLPGESQKHCQYLGSNMTWLLEFQLHCQFHYASLRCQGQVMSKHSFRLAQLMSRAKLFFLRGPWKNVERRGNQVDSGQTKKILSCPFMSCSSESTAFTEGGISKTLGTCMLPCQLCYFLFFFLVQLPN